MIREVMHIGITVSNMEKSIHFYKDILGLTFKGEAMMEGKETDLTEKEAYIDDLFMQTYDGEVLFDENIYKGIDKKAFEIEELGNKKLEKTEQSVNLYKLKFE